MSRGGGHDLMCDLLGSPHGADDKGSDRGVLPRIDGLDRRRPKSCLLQRPAEGPGRSEGTIDADHNAGLHRPQGQVIRIAVDDHDRAVGILNTLIADRAQKQLLEPALAACSHHQ
jgi:hypothetical protein